MKVRRVVLTEKPYPTCVLSGKQLGYFDPVYELTRDDGEVIFVHYKSILDFNKIAP